MAGETISPPRSGGTKMSSEKALSPSYVNLFRISTCCDRLAMHVREGTNKIRNPNEFFNLCLSLARGIDYAVANKEVPSKVRELPVLLKLVCNLKHDSFLHAAILVLMISIKNACRSGWFSDDTSTELCRIADEILRSFCSTMNFTTEPSSFQSTISTIMSRYYPTMKMGAILAFLGVKPGYGTYVHDFQITKDVKSSQGERIRLFVAQADNMETPSCLITPTQGNFLLNGKGVERRYNNFMDTGPQMPTPVNHFLKYGTNLIQAVGQFDGNFIIVIAFMSLASTPDHSIIQDYVQPSISMIDPDSELIEGPSRVSLNCPISFKRIDVPAKGHMCKHRQCFDYHNYMDINSRRPSWRCPHCNQHVCFTDLRIDQNVVKVLKELSETVSAVMISSDGSWKAITESDDQCDKSEDKTPSSLLTESVQLETPANPPGDIMDLTVDDYDMDTDMDTMEIGGIDDRKVSIVNAQNDSKVQSMAENPRVSNIGVPNQHTAAPIEDDFWSGVFLSTCVSEASNSQLVSRIGVSEPSSNNLILPVLTDASTPVPYREAGHCRGDSQLGQSPLSNEYGHISSIPRHITRTPIAVQALGVPPPTSQHQQRPRNHLMIENSPSMTPQTSTVSPTGDTISSFHSNIDKQQHFPGVHQTLHQTQIGLSRMQQYSTPQNIGRQTPSQVPGSYRVRTSGQYPIMNMRPGTNQSAGMMRPLASSAPPLLYQGGPPTSGVVGSQQSRALATQRAAMMARVDNTSRAPSHYPMNTNELRTPDGSHRESMPSQPSLGDVTMDATADQDWRPTGRMRGSLSGRAYSDAFNQYIIRPTQQPQGTTQQGQASAPFPILNGPNFSSSELELFMANRAALNAAGIHPPTGARSHWS